MPLLPVWVPTQRDGKPPSAFSGSSSPGRPPLEGLKRGRGFQGCGPISTRTSLKIGLDHLWLSGRVGSGCRRLVVAKRPSANLTGPSPWSSCRSIPDQAQKAPPPQMENPMLVSHSPAMQISPSRYDHIPSFPRPVSFRVPSHPPRLSTPLPWCHLIPLPTCRAGFLPGSQGRPSLRTRRKYPLSPTPRTGRSSPARYCTEICTGGSPVR